MSRAPLLLLAGLVACEPAPPSPALSVSYAGCRGVTAEAVCEVDGPLTLWVDEPAAVAAVLADGAPVPTSPESTDQGARWRLTPPDGATQVTLTPADPATHAPFTLRLAARATPPAVRAAQDKAAAGDLEGAVRTLSHALPKLAGTPDEGRLESVRGRLLYGLGRPDDAVAALRAGAAAHAATGRTFEQVRDLCLISYIEVQRGDLAGARAVTRGIPRQLPDNLDLAYLVAYNDGLIATLAGDYRATLEQMGRAARVAEQMGDAAATRSASDRVSDTFLRLGRFPEALALNTRTLEAATSTAPDDCGPAFAKVNLAWTVFMAGEAGADLGAAPDPEGLLTTALDALAGCPGQARQQTNGQLNLALVRLQAGDVSAAAVALDAVGDPAALPEVEDRLWALEAAARIAHQQDQPADALALRDRQAQQARQHLSLEMERRAVRGRADALRALGRIAQSDAAYSDAAELGRRHAALAPAQAGRDGFLHQQADTAAAHIELLLGQGEAAGALAVLRRYRAAFVRSQAVAARVEALPADEQARFAAVQEEYGRLRHAAAALQTDAWQQSAREIAANERERDALAARAQALLDGLMAGLGAADAPLRPPAPGELLLAWMPVEGGVAGFAASSAGVRGALLRDPGADAAPQDQASAWLTPFADEIAAAERVTLLPAGRLRAIDLAALPWGAGPLAAALPVAWGMDLPARAPATEPFATVAVVGDPAADLPAARAEAASVADGAAAAGLQVTRLVGDAATRPATLRALRQADLLHYAGHGAAGDAAWDSALLLAGGARLTAADALASPSVPRRVVLSSCETAATAATDVAGLGVAQAFVVAGAEAVIGAVRPVPDEVAATFSTSLYSAPLDADVAAAFHRALGATRLAHPGNDAWSAFRLLLP